MAKIKNPGSMPRHGLRGTSAYVSWRGMMARCNNPGDTGYANYGGRGIRVCERWHRFINFYADMGERPAGLTLDRKDTDGGYTPENCRWASHAEQVRNQRSNHILTVDGVSRCLTDWSRLYGIDRNTLATRLKAGWPTDVAVKLPLMHKSTT